MGNFKLKTEHFEGPLDLLLDLIEKRKLFINDISLSKVADDFISHVKNFENYPISESADFILVASTLLLIKSKSLLPNLSITEEEQGNIKDLEKRLQIYKKIKEASEVVYNLFGKELYFSANYRKFTPVFAPDESMNISNIHESIKVVINSVPKKSTLPNVAIRKVISLDEMVDDLTKRIKSCLKMSFKEFSSEYKAEKVNVIVSFLAMLELVKQGIIDANQKGNFDDIEMETESLGVPRY